jgi:6-phosphogluconolactonase
MTTEIEVLDDPARACAAMLVGAAAGGGHVVLTGGSSPRVAYEELVKAVKAVELDLTQSTFWFGDERCVPPEDELSNYRLAKESLIDPLGPENQPIVWRMKGELGPHEGADDYQRTLEEAGPPRFELVLLGIGPDGHCASLFPDQETLQERDRLVVGVEEAGLEPFVPRISMTLPTLTAARRVVFLATGSSKAEAVAKAFGPGAAPDPHMPSSLIPPLAEEVTVLLDRAAAERL